MTCIEKFAILYLKRGPYSSEYDPNNIAINYDKPKIFKSLFRVYLDSNDYKANNTKCDNYGEPIILYAVNKPEYRLPYGFEEFYRRFSEGVSFINDQVMFNSKLKIKVDDVMVGYNTPIEPFTSTCDEWLRIITDKYPKECDYGTNYVFINCNSKSVHFGRLLFVRTNENIPDVYLSSWHFEEFLMIMVDEYSRFEELEIKEIWSSCENKQYHMHLPSIINFFNDVFDSNNYFSWRNTQIKPMLNFLISDLSRIVLSYLYYNDINYDQNYNSVSDEHN